MNGPSDDDDECIDPVASCPRTLDKKGLVSVDPATLLAPPGPRTVEHILHPRGWPVVEDQHKADLCLTSFLVAGLTLSAPLSLAADRPAVALWYGRGGGGCGGGGWGRGVYGGGEPQRNSEVSR
ncbi:hypothetical protein NHX12_033607 [Muraenolepis orangiensis]|uniref:Uncharacterized protein n=1 Tax=Muraenolepis orangiensis TaxID=630683 RepID=A0A9Q0IJU3_9TELE|nr:hypothetical protein NHX12_033607 [Muraenolepis orangiensis]